MSSPYYNMNPTKADKIHCVLFVIKAANIDRDADDRTLKRVHKYLADNSKSTIVAEKKTYPSNTGLSFLCTGHYL